MIAGVKAEIRGPSDAEALAPTEDERALVVGPSEFGAPGVVRQFLDGRTEVGERDHPQEIGVTPVEGEAEQGDLRELPGRDEQQVDADDVDRRADEDERFAPPPPRSQPVGHVADDGVGHHVRQARQHDDGPDHGQLQSEPVRVGIERRQVDRHRKAHECQRRRGGRVGHEPVGRQGRRAPGRAAAGGSRLLRPWPQLTSKTRAKFSA